eukprot:9081807-Alexandrium_andersonii.AAC.1
MPKGRADCGLEDCEFRVCDSMHSRLRRPLILAFAGDLGACVNIRAQRAARELSGKELRTIRGRAGGVPSALR